MGNLETKCMQMGMMRNITVLLLVAVIAVSSAYTAYSVGQITGVTDVIADNHVNATKLFDGKERIIDTINVGAGLVKSGSNPTITLNGTLSAASIVVYKNATKYYAINGTTGAVAASGTDASTVIQGAINSLTSGGSILIKAGTYTIAKQINVTDGLYLKGEGKRATILQMAANANIDMIAQPSAVTSPIKHLTIESLMLHGKAGSNTSGRGINLFCTHCYFSDMIITSFQTDGVRFYGGSNSNGIRFFNNRISNVFGNGTVIESGISDGYFYGNNPIAASGDNGLVDTADQPTSTTIKPGEAFLRLIGGGSWNIFGNQFSGGLLIDHIVVMQGGGNIRWTHNIFNKAMKHSVVVMGSNPIQDNEFIGNHFRREDNPTNLYDHIFVNNTNTNGVKRWIFEGNTFEDMRYMINTQGKDQSWIITGNQFFDIQSSPLSAISGTTSTTKVYRNIGYVTENSNSVTINSGSTSITVNHGLDYTPAGGDISLTVMTLTTNDIGYVYVTNITSTQFTINVKNDPGASGANIGWSVRRT
jgi:hypothetical protein